MSDLAVMWEYSDPGVLVLAIPRPSATLDVYGLCQTIEAEMPEIKDVDVLKDAKNKLGAIAEYVRRTSKSGVAQLQTTMRHLEVRCGEVLGPAKCGPPQSSVTTEDSLTRHERTDFRAMADHKEVVEAVIAKSDDANPPSRNKVMTAIAFKQLSDVEPTRKDIVTRLATEGHSSKQIAKELGISTEVLALFVKAQEIDIPADALVKHTHQAKFDSNRIVGAIVATVTDVGLLLDHVDYSQLDRDQFPHWVDSLSEAIKVLRNLRTNLNKESTQ